MIVLQAVVVWISRSIGKILNTVFGWASVLLFGKVPQKRQIHMSAITFGSIIWIVVLLGIIFPSLGTFLLTAVVLPKWVDQRWIRLAMLAGVIVIPPIVGAAALLMRDPGTRPRSAVENAKAVLKGYLYTVGFALTLVTLSVFAPILKVRNVLRRWTECHVPVIVEAQDYMDVVADVQQALRTGAIETRRVQATWMLRLPTKVLTYFAGAAVRNVVADNLTTLVASQIEVLMHPSDLVISGRERDVARARAIISEHLSFTKAYLTWEKEAHELEDRLRRIWAEVARTDLPDPRFWEELRVVERDLRAVYLAYEEWEVLFRRLSIVKLTLLQARSRSEPVNRQPSSRSPSAQRP